MAQHKLLFKTDDFTEHDIIADGRCFSGAAYYVLVSKGNPFSPRTKKADSDTLNRWIQSDIIVPIIAIGRDPTNKNFVSYMDWVYDYNLVPNTRVKTLDVDPKLEAALNECFELSDFGSGNIHNLLNSASHDLDTLGFINVDSDALLDIFKVTDATKITRKMINNKKQENALRIMGKACFKRYEKNYLDYIKNLASKGWTEPHYGPAQVLSDNYKKNVIILVDNFRGDLTPAFMTSPQNKTENNVYIKTGDGGGHFYALVMKDPLVERRAKQLAVEASRKDIDDVIRRRANKKKEAADFAAGIAASREPAKPTVSSHLLPSSSHDAGLGAAIEASLKSEEARKASLLKTEEKDPELAAVMAASLKSEEDRKASLKKEDDAKLVTPAKPPVIPAKPMTVPPVIPTKPTTVPPVIPTKPTTVPPVIPTKPTTPVVVSPTTPMVPTKPTTVPPPTTPMVPTTSSTSTSTPVKCSVSKTQIPIYYVVFTSPNQLGDYNYMIKQPEYKNTLFIFNDNQEKHNTSDKGSGNAVIRPYNFYGLQKSRLAKPLSAGIPTGNGKSNKGYSLLDQLTILEIDSAISEIKKFLRDFKYDQIIYSGTNNQNPRFKGDPEDLIGIGKYEVSKKVREYITQQIKCLGDFKGKLKQTTPLKDIQNAAIMLFVNNSAKVVFVHDPKNNKWMLPGGRIDNKETPWAAAAREYEEEVGYKLPSNLQEKDFDYYDQLHSKGEYTRIFIGKTDVKSPPYDITKVKNKETDKLECRLLSDVLLNQQNYSPVILKSTEAIYNKINKEGEYLEYAKPEIAPQSTTTAPQSTTTRTAPVSEKNVTFSQIPESLSKSTTTPSKDNLKYVKESFPKKLTNNNSNKNNITERNNQYLSTRNKIQNGYVMAANSIKKYNNAPFTSNPKQHIAMGTGAGLAVLAGLTFVGGKKNLSRKKRTGTGTGTRKRSRKTQKSSCFSLHKRRKGKKCYKTHKKRR